MWLIRTDILTAFENEEIKSSIPRYISAVKDKLPALFLLASRFPVDRSSKTDELWTLHDELMDSFWDFVDSFNNLELPPKPPYSLLDLKADIANRILTSCELCERRCLVDRTRGELGICRIGRSPRVSTYFIHMGEEAPISPSGTIFFSSCNFRCVFCQNWDISQNPTSGQIVNPAKLSNMFVSLRKEGARNINLVGGEPTPNIPAILDALKLTNINVPIIWNSNMYLTPKAMKLLIGLIDLWLPDFKYWNEEHALRLSGIPNYTKIVKRNLKMAYEARGEMVIRHLVLPNHVECCTKPILRWISENLPNALVNVMAQYRPEYRALRYQEIARRPNSAEMKEAYKEAERSGLRWRSVS
ncbi:MAG TPA: radical SAM protein [Candidatus Korarchaeota archaeon]|nr:radical SAM protein [Candidatus Korarchaeota archaeon]